MLVRVRAAGINGADILQRAGGYPAPPGSPPTFPDWNLPARSPRSARAPRASRSATASWRSPAAAGRPSCAVVHERQAMPVPANLSAGPRPAGCRKSSPRRTTRSSRSAGCGRASVCSFTARPAESARAAVQLGANCGAIVTASVRNATCTTEVAVARRRLRRHAGAGRGRTVRRDPRTDRRAEPHDRT